MNQKEIAERLNISQATVSMALRRSPRISENMIEAVGKLAHEEGYQPDFAGRMLRNGKTNLIGIMFPSIVNPFFAELFHELLGIFRKHGYIGYVSEVNNEQEMREAVDQLRQLKIAGVVAFGWCRDVLIQNHRPLFPLVFFDGDDHEELILLKSGETLVGSVRSDSREAVEALACELIASGRKRPLFVGSSTSRFYDFAKIWKNEGINVPLISSKACMQAGYEAIKTVFSGRWKPDCIFCYNDEIARGVYRAAYEKGLRIPDDVAVAGYDNIEAGQYMIPALTTIELPRKQIAHELATELLATINGERTHKRVMIPCKYISRESI